MMDQYKYVNEHDEDESCNGDGFGGIKKKEEEKVPRQNVNFRNLTKEEFEAEINELVHQYSEIKNSDCVPGTKTELLNLSLRIKEDLYCYTITYIKYNAIYYGVELMDTVSGCLKNFNMDAGDFINYFNRSWSLTFKSCCNKTKDDKSIYKKMGTTDNMIREIDRADKFLCTISSSMPEKERYEKLREAMGWSQEHLYSVLKARENKLVSGFVDDEGERQSLDEFVSDGSPDISEIVTSDMCESDFMHVVDQVYEDLQERQKPIISDWLTSQLFSAKEVELSELSGFSFISEDIVDLYKCGEDMPTQRDLAEKYERDEASISRTVKGFIKKVKMEME